MSEINQTTSTGRGGARKGAGRKPGSVTKKTREIAEKAVEEGITPLEYMLQVMRREPPEGLEGPQLLTAHMMRFEAAKAAAPYIHPKLSAVEHTGKDGGPMETVTRIELVDLDGDGED